MGVTTRDVAKAAGVSQSTVSVVLNNNPKISISPETRAHVLKIADQLGYQFKKRVKNRDETELVGLLVPTLSNMYYPMLVPNVESYARTQGINIVMQNTMRSREIEERSFDFFRKIGVRGVLCLYSPQARLPEDLVSVIVGERLPNTDADTVGLNSYAAGQLIAEHILSLGHKDIAFISTPLSKITSARQKRLDGVRDAMTKAGLIDRLVMLIDDNENESAVSYEYECGARLTKKILEQYPQCTAIIAVNDMTAYGCIRALNENHVAIPEQVAVCGFDNLMLDQMTTPQLTSVDQMAFHGCKIGLNVLMQRINVTAVEGPVYMEYMPIIHARASTVK